MNKTIVSFLLALIAIAVVVAGGWHHSREQLRQVRVGELASITALLLEDQEILGALQMDSSDSGILAAYLTEIRADGIAKHAGIKVKLDRLAENNAGILALINAYRPHAKTLAFSAAAEKFQRYAIAWRDRWNSVMELFMAGGNYPVAEVPFPLEFLGAVQAEVEAVQRVL